MSSICLPHVLNILIIFGSFQTTNVTEKTVGFSGIRTRIVGVDGKHAGHLTTAQSHFLSCPASKFHLKTCPSEYSCLSKTHLFVLSETVQLNVCLVCRLKHACNVGSISFGPSNGFLNKHFMIQAPFCLSINFFYLLSLCPISSSINMSISLSICVHFDLTLCLFLYIFHLFCFYLFFIRVFKFLFLHLLCFFYFIYLRVRVHCYPEQLDIKNQFFIAWKAIFIFAIFIFMARRFV